MLKRIKRLTKAINMEADLLFGDPPQFEKGGPEQSADAWRWDRAQIIYAHLQAIACYLNGLKAEDFRPQALEE